MSATMKNFHLPLSPAIHRRLKKEARIEQIPATQMARNIIEEWIQKKERDRIAADITKFATAFAGTEFDLDQDLESEAIKHLTESNQ